MASRGTENGISPIKWSCVGFSIPRAVAGMPTGTRLEEEISPILRYIDHWQPNTGQSLSIWTCPLCKNTAKAHAVEMLVRNSDI